MSESPTAIPQGSWVLVTGANGYSGSHVVMELLKHGFNVRGTVRNLEYSQWLLDHPSVKPFVDQGRVELVLADTSKPDDFDEAVKGVAAVIHLAIVSDISPDPDTTIPATVEAALTVCRAAAKAPSVKRFVFSSTFWAAVMPVPDDSSTITNLETWNEDMVKAARAPPPYEWSRMLPVFLAAKVEAEKAVWKYVEENELPWVVNSVSPCWILGDPLHERHLLPLPMQLLQQLYLGKTDAMLDTSAVSTVYYAHVSDVASIYVAATIDPDVKGSRIQVLAGSLNWNDCLAIMRTAYPTVEFPDDFVPGNPTLTYKIEQDIALGLLRKWAGRDWISPERSITEIIDFCKQQGILD
ncbi:Rhodanese domain-containing protein [Fusarium falciforme]|uniref:Rhodanese domain-containing protein n=1 Tax=Fusarium falciforme TaxID=195108 RepID=UPI0023000629|nr:Rhodanese domain-containing protein [Fusarium falciforme]WAO84716.1 Rhodanese domain-containing protein [Fusarium falciforme]